MGKNTKSKLLNPINATLLILVLGGIGFFVYQKFSKTLLSNQDSKQQSIQSQTNTSSEPTTIKTKLKSFTGEEFKDLYNNFAYPNTEYIIENSEITGDPEVDLYIQNFAEARGYLRRSAPVVDVFKQVDKDIVLQERAYQPWLDLKSAAQKDGQALYLTAGYRSKAEQKSIFLSRFYVQPKNYIKILTGVYDQTLTDVLSSTAIPGYSRHHNGYTIDIGCLGQNQAFEFTSCFEWLSQNNYENSKKYGWIPSYPEEAQTQGPEPETWEYAWVGVDAVME